MRHESFNIDGYNIVITFHDDKSELLLEAKHKGAPLIGTYSVIKHQPHNPTGDYHLHVYNGNNQIFAINKNGTAHDGFHGVKIPSKVYNELKKRYTDWLLPANKIIESINYTFILENITELTYKELLTEVEVIQSELNFIGSIEKNKNQKLTESISQELINTKELELQNRFTELFMESVKRIS